MQRARGSTVKEIAEHHCISERAVYSVLKRPNLGGFPLPYAEEPVND